MRAMAGDEASDLYVRAIALEGLLLHALESLDDGPVGHATRLLFGAVPETRGRLLKDRRRLAAEELDVLPSTFRKNYESALVADLAIEVWRDLSSYRATQPASVDDQGPACP